MTFKRLFLVICAILKVDRPCWVILRPISGPPLKISGLFTPTESKIKVPDDRAGPGIARYQALPGNAGAEALPLFTSRLLEREKRLSYQKIGFKTPYF